MNPLRPVILAASASPRMQRIVTGTPVTVEIVRRFVAGAGRDELIPVVRELLASRRLISVDFPPVQPLLQIDQAPIQTGGDPQLQLRFEGVVSDRGARLGMHCAIGAD